ncbi:PTS sugar transporter subunit IIA [Fusobacterium mortiferum]|jgi:PTS system fructose-specific IIA component|uniref:PTS fructose transporter subunit IIA n=1 Tax=Fusobacterium mortiferum ATCC 9817 TaxID=469616 RepID=A0ABM6TUD7_FUSMR|nr:fructose PTS transporter subunit IIA [Fusobacterium mortiferum]AVQ18364.1 PTS fructose transporter subunit IIA [Fusobacterium mortiferum ATCC 9817]EEO34598.1 phosphoenolpyruvate-dependent sugar phosphotransferase system, EIIA 2 [Fusobacterium mortiferum ATCC 9817]
MNKILKEQNIFLDVESRSKDELIETLAEKLDKMGKLFDKNIFIEDIYKREAEGITGIENGLALPHGKSSGVKETTILVAKLKTPIEWETLDDSLVDLVVLFAVKLEDKNDVHLKLLSRIAGNLSEEENILKIKELTNKEEIIKILEEEW